MKTIPLTRGMFTKVDDEDYKKYAIYRWQAIETKSGFRACRQIKINGKRVNLQLSRVILNNPLNMYVDHINGNSLDNRKCNLRTCTPSDNSHNQEKQKHNTSGYKGVSWNKRNKKWFVIISSKNKQFYLGVFDDVIKAAKTYDDKARELHGKFAKTNFK